MNALATHGLSKSYGEQTVVAALDLAVPQGTLYGFLGPNGAGKTTTIRMLLGLVKPSAGRAELLGEEVIVGASAAGVLDKVGALIEEPGLWPYLSGRSNLVCMARSGGRDERLSRIDEVLEVVGLSGAATKRVKAYSQGMRQRLGIALALLGSPEVLVLDEPTNGLDPPGMREIRELLRRLADDGVTVFVSSHLLFEVEAMCDRVGVLAGGRLIAEGTPAELRAPGESLRIEVDDAARASEVLAQLRGLDVESEDHGSFRVSVADDLNPAEINRKLVSAGVGVRALVPERRSLEEVFMTLIEGSG
ncbi:MAG: ABC transporter ATP-binding protein [Actinomycetota bacterium]|nr:ABC transporter ATP-binding protein [Actinomycetota bacterium]